jgi:hypothetical protein
MIAMILLAQVPARRDLWLMIEMCRFWFLCLDALDRICDLQVYSKSLLGVLVVRIS